MAQADRKTRQVQRDIVVLGDFIAAYCRKEHSQGEGMCDSCRELFEYSAERRRKCPMEPKPRCSSCRVGCYAEPYRSRIRKAMRAGAVYYVRHGRVGTLLGYALGKLKDKLWK